MEDSSGISDESSIDVPTTAMGGSITAGFGIDASLRTSRELVDRTEQTQGGNTVTTFDYRLSVDNFGDKPARIRLLDRIPKPDGNMLKPTLVKSSVELSKDPEYERIVRETCDYVLRDMTSPEGGFYSAEDADSEGFEGTFYLWTPAKVKALTDEKARIEAKLKDAATKAEEKPALEQRLAAIDVGSNSIRLLVAEYDPASGIKVIDEVKDQPRLASGIAESGRLEEFAMARAIQALTRMREVAERRAAERAAAAADRCAAVWRRPGRVPGLQ